MNRQETIAYMKAAMTRNKLNQRSWALKAGLHEDTVRNFFRGNTQVLRHDHYEKLMSVIDKDGEAPVPAIMSANEETILVPAYDVALSAGGGALIEQENIRYHLTFRLDWIRRITSAPLEMLAVLDVDGDSMLPTLAPGDSVLIDLTQTYPKRDGIHALRYDGAALIKRVQIDPVRQRACILSDNPAYPPITDIDPREIQVLGRALWIGRRV